MTSTIENCWWKHTLNDCDAYALVWYVRKNSRATVFKLSMSVQDIIRLSARAIFAQPHRDGFYTTMAVGKKKNRHLRVQEMEKPTGTGLQRWGESDKVRWVILYHILEKWISTHVVKFKRTVNMGLVSLLCKGAFCWHDLAPLVPLEGKLTANHYKVILTDHLDPVMSRFYSDGSSLFQDDPTHIHRAWEFTEPNPISTQLHTYGRFHNALHHHLQNTLGKEDLVFIPPV